LKQSIYNLAKGQFMSEITRVGADLAKAVIQVNAVDAAGKLVTNRQLSRDKFLPWCAQLTSYAYAMQPGDDRRYARVENFVAAIKRDSRLLEAARRHKLDPIAAPD
jgi:hypothetical protein